MPPGLAFLLIVLIVGLVLWFVFRQPAARRQPPSTTTPAQPPRVEPTDQP